MPNQNPVIRYLRRQPPWGILSLASSFLLLIAYLDWITGPELRLGVFYLVPLTLVTIFMGRRAGLIMAVVSAGTWLVAELRGKAEYSRHTAAYANAGFRFLFFLVTVWLLSAWREIGRRMEEQIQQRTADLKKEVSEKTQGEKALHDLADKLAEAEDAERRRLAHEIHDALGQTLTVMKMTLESASKADGSAAGAALGECLRLLNIIIQQTRTLTFELHPPMLDDLGLVPALRWQAKGFGAQTNSQVTVAESGEARKLPVPLASYLFRSIKELMNNAAKHGHATEIVITVYWRGSDVRAVVDDNGAGFDPAVTRPAGSGLGLAGIRERATTLGGNLQVESEAGKGARAILQLPLAL